MNIKELTLLKQQCLKGATAKLDLGIMSLEGVSEFFDEIDKDPERVRMLFNQLDAMTASMGLDSFHALGEYSIN